MEKYLLVREHGATKQVSNAYPLGGYITRYMYPYGIGDLLLISYTSALCIKACLVVPSKIFGVPSVNQFLVIL
jgi:hypothetical protein